MGLPGVISPLQVELWAPIHIQLVAARFVGLEIRFHLLPFQTLSILQLDQKVTTWITWGIMLELQLDFFKTTLRIRGSQVTGALEIPDPFYTHPNPSIWGPNDS